MYNLMKSECHLLDIFCIINLFLLFPNAVFVERSRETLPATGAASEVNADASGSVSTLILVRLKEI